MSTGDENVILDLQGNCSLGWEGRSSPGSHSGPGGIPHTWHGGMVHEGSDDSEWRTGEASVKVTLQMAIKGRGRCQPVSP